MCEFTDTSHVALEVPPGARREVARVLLAAARGLGLDGGDPCHVAAVGAGFRVSAAVFAASGLELASPPPGLVAMLEGLGERARRARSEPAAAVAPAEVEAPAPVEVPDPAPSAPKTRKRKN